MILSFHPCITGDQNILCAGRPPGVDDLGAIKSADAVILPQGCTQPLYDMVRRHCPNRFPNFDARFDYPGKIGQIRLFRKQSAIHPDTRLFQDVQTFDRLYGQAEKMPFEFPFVFKFDWGGEGYTVFLIDSSSALQNVLKKAADFERSDARGFLIQEFIPTDQRSLRVAVVGETIQSYWRVKGPEEPFRASVSTGGAVDAASDPHLQQQAVASVKNFCRQTGINLAGFDLLFSTADRHGTPIFLEINYFFGREGLGGSEKFYQLLEMEVNRWLSRLGLSGKPLTG